jgi:26S proteasome regulatory subunit N8
MSNFLLETVKAQPCSMVVVHPTVLLSIVDHYNRSGNATTSKRRVVGTLIGEYGDKGQLHVTNSFAVPFEEDLADSDIWFFDHVYHEEMYEMMKKINSKEKILGWYSTGPTIRKSDIQINEILRRYNTNPVFVVCNV